MNFLFRLKSFRTNHASINYSETKMRRNFDQTQKLEFHRKRSVATEIYPGCGSRFSLRNRTIFFRKFSELISSHRFQDQGFGDYLGSAILWWHLCSRCGTAAERTPHHQEVTGSNLAGCWASSPLSSAQ